jgi:hypothetical protein
MVIANLDTNYFCSITVLFVLNSGEGREHVFSLLFLAYFPYFEEKSRLMRLRCCPCVSVYPLLSLLGNGSVETLPR